MSNTPRTDAAMVRMERLDGDIDEVVSADFARQLERENTDLLEKLRAATSMPCAPSATGAIPTLWLWKNFVDGRPEYWAFDNPYPCVNGGGDPLTLGADRVHRADAEPGEHHLAGA